VVRKDLNMRKGKIAAQCCHASMSFLTKSGDIYSRWGKWNFETELTKDYEADMNQEVQEY
jgi:peptidyl-tRNA hydrolase